MTSYVIIKLDNDSVPNRALTPHLCQGAVTDHLPIEPRPYCCAFPVHPIVLPASLFRR